MNITKQNKAIWRNLYEVATEFRALKPWQWFYDSDIFVVYDPKSGTPYFCCVIGIAGELEGLLAYVGEEGWNSYKKLQQSNIDEEFDEMDMEAAFTQKCIAVSFLDRDELEQEDYDAIKTLGIKCRGKKQWIEFRKHDPYLYPWFIDDVNTAECFTHIIEQAILVCKRTEEDKALIRPGLNKLFARKAIVDKTGLKWEDSIFDISSISFEEAPIVYKILDTKKAELTKKQYKKHPDHTIYFSSQLAPTPVQEQEDQRPFLPFFMAFSDLDFQPIHVEICKPDELMSKLETFIFEYIENVKSLPKQINVIEESAFSLIEPYTNYFGIDLKLLEDDEIPHLETEEDFDMGDLFDFDDDDDDDDDFNPNLKIVR